ncbi:MAG: ATP-binding protein [Halobacteriovoraceae bacterium]|nr:ATP-binding protein [Halobacteriovoraceae bacterium]
MFDNLLEGVQVLDRELRYTYINKVAAAHGKSTPEELIGKKMVEAYPGIDQSEVFKKILHSLKENLHQTLENKFIHNDGSIGWYDLHIMPHPEGVLIFSLDITEKKAYFEDHYHKVKLDALQKFSAGVAHDFNNKLLIFELSFNAIKRDYNLEETVVKSLKNNIQSSKELIKTLLGYVDPTKKEVPEVEVTSFIQELPMRYKHYLGDNVSLEVSVKKETNIIPLTPVQLDQVLLNLIVNSKQAFDPSRNGIIKVLAQREEIQNLSGKHPTLLPPGEYIHITVEDNGQGMKEAVIEKAFDYYFTTKPTGMGTGLGLATIKTIVNKSGGKIFLESEVGKGTKFDIWLKSVSLTGLP